MSIKIAVVSDLHCHHSSTGPADTLLLSDMPRRPEKNHPVSALDQLIQQDKLSTDILMMPGDLANRADPQGINSAWDEVGKIARSLQAKVTAATLGNHDVIWKAPVDNSFKLANDLLPQFPTSDPELYKHFWADGFYIEEKENYRILVVNSVWHQTNEVSAKRGLISTSQLDSIEKRLSDCSPKAFQIALCHHHPIQHEEIDLGPNDLMENGSIFVDLLSKYKFSLLVHGHKHHPRLRVGNSGGYYLPVFAAGSFSAGMKLGLGTRARNVFHIIELEDSSDNTSPKGTIKTWQFQVQRGWTKATYSAADFPHLAGFGSNCQPDELASLVERTFNSHDKEIISWTHITTSIPEIQWVPPSTLNAVNRVLSTRGFQLSPSAPDRPQTIGKYA